MGYKDIDMMREKFQDMRKVIVFHKLELMYENYLQFSIAYSSMYNNH